MLDQHVGISKITVRKLGGSRVVYLPKRYRVDYNISEGDRLQIGIRKESEDRYARDIKVKRVGKQSDTHYITIPPTICKSLSLDKGDKVNISLKPESDSITTKEELEERGMG